MIQYFPIHQFLAILRCSYSTMRLYFAHHYLDRRFSLSGILQNPSIANNISQTSRTRWDFPRIPIEILYSMQTSVCLIVYTMPMWTYPHASHTIYLTAVQRFEPFCMGFYEQGVAHESWYYGPNRVSLDWTAKPSHTIAQQRNLWLS